MSGHLSRFVLDKLLRGELTSQDLSQILLDHLARVCPECHQALAEMAKGLGLEDLQGNGTLDASTFYQAVEEDRRLRQERARDLASDLEEAGELAPHLVLDGPAEDFANPDLALRLLSRAWTACRKRRPATARALGLATKAVGRRLGEVAHFAELSFDYRLAGLTVAANAARIEDRFEIAFQLLEEAEELVQDVADPSILSDYFRVAGSVHRDAGVFVSSVAYYKEAIRFATDAHDTVRLVKVRANMAWFLWQQGKAQDALQALEAGLQELRAVGDGSSELVLLELSIHSSRILYLIDSGDLLAAQEIFELLDPRLFEEFGQEARYYWLRARLAKAGGDQREALRLFKKAHDLFKAPGFPVEASLVLPEVAESALAVGDREAFHQAGLDLARLTDTCQDKVTVEQVRQNINRYLTHAA